MKTKIVGITGTIASGKSLVGKLLADENITVLDTDHIGHELLSGDVEVKAALRQRFGAEIFDDAGHVDRKCLGEIIFNDASARQDLNHIMHPAIMHECRRQISEHAGEPLVAVLVPLLFEAGLANQYDEIWTVTASDSVVRQRLKERDGISDADAEKRIKAQFSQSEKIARSKFVIDNSGIVEATRKQVLELLGKEHS